MNLKKDLSFFDLTSIIIGAIVGADIYIASAITAGLVGPIAIFVWVIAGMFALVLALVFAYSKLITFQKLVGRLLLSQRRLIIFMDFLQGGVCG